MNAEARPFIDHLVIDRTFLSTHELGEVLKLLDAQGWNQLNTSMCTLNTKLARQFFSILVIYGEDAMILGQVTINRELHQFTVRELGLTLGIPPARFNQYVKC